MFKGNFQRLFCQAYELSGKFSSIADPIFPNFDFKAF